MYQGCYNCGSCVILDLDKKDKTNYKRFCRVRRDTVPKAQWSEGCNSWVDKNDKWYDAPC